MEVIFFYFFVEDKLAASVYGFTIEHSNKNQYLDDFTKIEELLESVYGKPTEKKTNWISDDLRDSPSMHGFALSLGEMEKETSWETDSTYIDHLLSSEDYIIFHKIEYLSKEHMDELRKSISQGL